MAAEVVRWSAVFTGPEWQALSVQSLLDEAGFRTQVPDARAYLTEEIVLALTVLVPQYELAAACAALETQAKPSEPRSP